jgi:hypothetical protein
MTLPALHGESPFRGVERRRHKVLVTENSEYLFRDDRCIAVRSRTSGRFVDEHHAVGLRLTYGIRYGLDGIEQVSVPHDLLVGERLCLSEMRDGREFEVITSPLLSIGRASRDVVERYDACA